MNKPKEDPAKNLMSKVVNSVATSYTYDEIDQLKSEISSNLFGVHDLYTYDANGNRATNLTIPQGVMVISSPKPVHC